MKKTSGSQINISDFFLYPVGSNTQMRRAYGKNNFSGGTIPPGSTGTITIYYQVPTQAGMYELDFQLHAVYAGTHHCDITVPSGN